MIRTVLAAATVAAGVTAVVAQSGPLSQRTSLMKENGRHLAAINRMVRGEDPFDATKVNAAFAVWSETARGAPALFPAPPKPGEESRSLPKIWANKSDFEANFANFRKVVTDNKDKAKTLDTLKVAAPLISKACDDCHEPYRRPKSARAGDRDAAD